MTQNKKSYHHKKKLQKMMNKSENTNRIRSKLPNIGFISSRKSYKTINETYAEKRLAQAELVQSEINRFKI